MYPTPSPSICYTFIPKFNSKYVMNIVSHRAEMQKLRELILEKQIRHVWHYWLSGKKHVNVTSTDLEAILKQLVLSVSILTKDNEIVNNPNPHNNK